MSYAVFQQLEPLLNSSAIFPVQGIKITGAFRARSQRVTHQLCCCFRFDQYLFVHEFLVIPDLCHSFIIGADFLRSVSASLVSREGNFFLRFPWESQEVEIVEQFLAHCPDNTLPSPRICAVASHDNTIVRGRKEPIADFTDFTGVQVGEDIQLTQKEQLFELLRRFPNLFSDRPGRVSCYEHEIHLTDERPFFVKQYPIPIAHRPAVEEQISGMVEWGIISRSDTPFSSPLLTTVKKDGSVRLCLDARRLNSVMQADSEQPRTIEDILHSIGHVRYMSSLDLLSSYWQIPIVAEHRKYTGFRVGSRAYYFNVLPFGLKTAVSSFTRCMDQVLGDILGDFVHAYIDDLFIVSNSFEEHLQHLRSVLERLSVAGFTLRADKCCFFRKSVNFCGAFAPTPHECKEFLSFLRQGMSRNYKRLLD